MTPFMNCYGSEKYSFLNIISSGRILMLISDRPIMSPDPCVIWAVEIKKLPWTCPGRGWTCSGSRLPWGHLAVGTCCTWFHKNSGRNLRTLTQRTYSPASCGLDLTLKHCILISMTNKCTCHTLLEFRKARVSQISNLQCVTVTVCRDEMKGACNWVCT